MTYWINVWRNSRPSKIDAEPVVQHWATEQQAIEEIVEGPPGYYYDETIRVEGPRATVVSLELQAYRYARQYDPKARRVNMPVETEAPE